MGSIIRNWSKIMKKLILMLLLSSSLYSQQLIYYYNGQSYRRTSQGAIGTDSSFTASATVDTNVIATKYYVSQNAGGSVDTTTLFAGKLGGWVEVQRTSDTTLNAANVTFVQLGQLNFTMASGGVYEIQARLWITKATDASAYTIALNCQGTPTNIGLVASGLGIATDGTDQVRTSIINTATDSIQQTAATAGNGKLQHVDFEGQIINEAANNTFQFRWHQEIASSGITLKRGSYIRYRRLY